jgi:hypothetical protein
MLVRDMEHPHPKHTIKAVVKQAFHFRDFIAFMPGCSMQLASADIHAGRQTKIFAPSYSGSGLRHSGRVLASFQN